MSEMSFEKKHIKILLLEGVHQGAVDAFSQDGYTDIDYVSKALSSEALLEKIKTAHIIGIRSRTQLTADILKSADKLMAVGCFCIGTNQIDLTTATQKGICVFNAPYSNTRSVAEMTLAEAILLLRGIPQKNIACHEGQWNKSAKDAHEIRGKKLGIVGYGNIGSQLSVMAESMGMEVFYYDVEAKLPLGNAIRLPSLDALLKIVDVVSLHVPETKSTQEMMNEKAFSLMKQGAIFINNARGSLVDISALQSALLNKQLLGAAIDVFPKEPHSNQEPFVSPLSEFNNVILTPHIGGSTIEAQENIGLEVTEKLKKYSDNGTTTSSVNFPEVALPSHPNQHRILHIHKNEPGVMKAVNQIFADNEININGQYLQTKDEIGYVVIDVASDVSQFALEKIKEVKHTIKARRLF
jgi:D-3-phosphoglycerate dehydrogenase